MQPCGWNCPRAEGQGSQKIVCFAHKILVFHFFSFFFFADGFAFRGLCAPLSGRARPLGRRARPSAYNVMAKDPTWLRCGSHRGQSNSGLPCKRSTCR
jgi:hypothetical protein